MPAALQFARGLAATALASAPFVLHGGPADVALPDDLSFPRDVLPLLADSCMDCHGGKEPEAGLSFERFTDEASAATAIGVWRKAREKLRAGEMPPPDAPAADRRLVEPALRWLDLRLGRGPQAWPLDPGRVTIHRLNRAEYQNTIRDLFDLDFALGTKLPADDVGYGFDNIGDVLALPPLLLEKYVALAEEIAAAALPGEEMRTARTDHFEAEAIHSTLANSQAGPVAGLFSNGAVVAEIALPRAGEYLLRARAWGDQAGPDPCRMEFRAAGKAVGQVAVPVVEQDAQVYEQRAQLAPGRQRVAVAFLNDYFQPENPDPGQRDRNLIIDWIEVVGPLDPFAPTPSERRIYTCAGDPPNASTHAHTHARACAPAILERLAARAWRRPIGAAELARLMPFVDRSLADGTSFAIALRRAVEAILVSPNFLFRSELDAAPNDAAAAHPLGGYELAARLSYFLWSSLPDERLTGFAAAGRLNDPATLTAETHRLLRDPRAGALVENFADQWLQLRSLERVAPDPALFPQFDEGLRHAMRLETELFFEAVLREGRPVRELLDADFTFVNERLARHYGIAGVRGERMQRVRVTDPRRGGLLGHASLLTVTSNPGRTSPVKRGKFLLERILGAPPPPPPPGVGALDESPRAAEAASLKQRLELHRKDPSCAVCHARMDALGFALERFDPIGGWREQDGVHPIDDAVTLPDGRMLAGATGLKRALAEDEAFVRCLTEKLLTYALGRGPTEDDRRAVAEIARRFDGRSPTLEELIVQIVLLEPFRQRRGEAPGQE